MSGAHRIGIQPRLIALFCAIGICASVSGVLPAFAALVGQLDADHDVSVSSFKGQVEVRFHHHEETPAVDADSGDADRAQPGVTDSHDDHVIRFAALDDALVPLASGGSDHDSNSFVLAEAERWMPVVRDYRPIVHPRPPPGLLSAALCLRSVVLLV